VSEVALRAEGLIVRLGGRTVLDIPRLEVRRGEVLALMGPNGSGKSTLILTLALLLRPAAGRLFLAGEPVGEGADLVGLRRRLAVVFQEPLLLDTTVRENVAVGLRLRRVPQDERERRVTRWLARFGLTPLAARAARTLSGGEAQRTSLARAFALEPEVLFLDEPFAALDAPTRAELIENLRAALAETGTTAVLVTHDRDEALALGDRVGVLMDGHLLQLDRPEAVFSAPINEQVAAFVGMETVLPAVIEAQQEGIAAVRVNDLTLEAVSPLPAGRAVLFCLRPEDVTLLAERGEAPTSSARNRLKGEVRQVGAWGTQVRVVVECGFPLVALVTRRSAMELGLEPGKKVTVSFKASVVYLIPKG
jgi:molybdopterin-binding protein